MIARPLDADHLLVIKGEPGRTDFPLYSLPFDGTAAKALGRVPGWQMGGGVSGNGVPDGKFFAFFSTGTPTSHIYDVDLSPIMQLVKKP